MTQPQKTIFTNCTLFKGAGEQLEPESYLITESRLITELGPMTELDITEKATVIDCEQRLLMPGLINSHNHCAMTMFRGLADDLELTSWLHDHIFPAEAKHVSPEMVYWCTRLAAAEMLLSGTACVADGYFFSSEAARALSDCAMRAVVAHGVVDFPAPSVPDPSKNIETVAAFIERWQGAHPLITPAVFAHAPYTCSPNTLTKAKELADNNSVRFFTHIAESRQEIDLIIDKQGESPIKHLAALGLLDDNSVCVHAIWLDHEDLQIFIESGSHVVTCPQSNLKLASGIAPIPELIAKGVTAGIGTDSCASNNSLDMFKEMDLLAKLHKLNSLDATSLPAQQVLKAATVDNGKILGLNNVGRLKVGWMADLIVLDTATPRLTPMYNPDLLVYGARGNDVHTVMIDGRLVVENSKILSFDLQETITRVRELSHTV